MKTARNYAPVTITPANYAKGRMVVKTEPDGSGWKTATMWLIEEMGGRWVNRYKGYQVSSRQAKRIERAVRLLQALNKP